MLRISRFGVIVVAVFTAIVLVGCGDKDDDDGGDPNDHDTRLYGTWASSYSGSYPHWIFYSDYGEPFHTMVQKSGSADPGLSFYWYTAGNSSLVIEALDENGNKTGQKEYFSYDGAAAIGVVTTTLVLKQNSVEVNRFHKQ